MIINKNIRKVLALVCWMIISSGVLVLLVAAINIKNRQTCTAVEIDITGVEEFFFLDRQDIRNMVAKGKIEKPEGQPLTSFNLQKLEATLEENIWVRDAELFFDNNMVLHVNISEREPIARIFTVWGKTYYIDSSAHTMPLSDKMSVRIPVFTGFPSDKRVMKGNDLALMKQVRNIALYISKNDFFKAQIAQTDITASGNFEMVPVIGNHLIEFGNGENAESKFRKLFIFYHQVLSKTGFDRYSKINVQYAKQVIGTRKGFTGKIDSVQALKNIEQLIEASKKNANDSVFTLVDKNLPLLKKAGSTLSVNTTHTMQDTGAVILKPQTKPSSVTNSERTYPSQYPLNKPQTNPSNVHDKPKFKAVMPKRRE